MADDELIRLYSELPYGGDPIFPTHPDALAAAAYLAGRDPAPVERCRVLEIGCAEGVNAMAMAVALPESRFVAFDLSPHQIAIGEELRRAAGIKNVELRALDLRDADAAALGEFDYVIAHGVYSWCPPDAQQKLLELCRAVLAPEGVAYVSYNVYPGWHFWGLWGGILRYGAREPGGPLARVAKARELLGEIVRGARPSFAPELYPKLLETGAELLGGATDAYIFHDEIAPYNIPVYFHQIAAQAAAVGLEYLGESGEPILVDDLSEDARALLDSVAGDRVAHRQYVDFLRNTGFHRSLFVRAGGVVDEPTQERVATLRVANLCEPEAASPDVAGGVVEAFRTFTGRRLQTDIPLIKAVLVTLAARAPTPLAIPELTAEVRARLDATDDPALDDGVITGAVGQLHAAGLVSLHRWAPTLVLTAGERPVVSPLARSQAVTSHRVATLRQRTHVADDLERALILCSDGTRDRPMLVQFLTRLGMPKEDVEAGIEPALARLGRAGLLLA